MSQNLQKNWLGHTNKCLEWKHTTEYQDTKSTPEDAHNKGCDIVLILLSIVTAYLFLVRPELQKTKFENLLCIMYTLIIEPHLPRRLKPHKYALSTLSPMSTSTTQIISLRNEKRHQYLGLKYILYVWNRKDCSIAIPVKGTTIRKTARFRVSTTAVYSSVRKEKLCLDMEVENICENISVVRKYF